MKDNTPLAREIVAALVNLNAHKEAVPSHGHVLFSAIRARYEQKAGNVEGGSLDDAAVEVVKEKLDAALSGPPTVGPNTLIDPSPDQPPIDDAHVAVGSTRFSDGQIQTEESLAAAKSVAPVETSTPPLGDLPAEPEPKEGE